MQQLNPQYCGLIDAKIRPSDKDLPASTGFRGTGTSDNSNFLIPHFQQTLDKTYVTLKIEEISSKNPKIFKFLN